MDYDPVSISGMEYLIDKSQVPDGIDINNLFKEEDTVKQKSEEEFEKDLDKIAHSAGTIETPIEDSDSNNVDDFLNSLSTSKKSENSEPELLTKSVRFTPSFEIGPSEMTNEEKSQKIVNGVFSDYSEESPVFSIEKEKAEDDKARKLEQISFLREALEDEGEDLSRIPDVDVTSSSQEIDSVLNHLSMKNDRKRCCTFAEEGIQLGAHLVEWIFDGEKSYLGFKPDMTDWHKSVATKLRRMRPDTSAVVSEIIKKYDIGSGTRIFLELIPNAILWSRIRKSQHKDKIVHPDEFQSAINKMRNYDI